MSDTHIDSKETEQKEGFQETFMSHLFELRDRVVKSAIVTPPDVLSQLFLAIPMCILYELGLFIARFYLPKTESAEEKSD